MKRAANDAPDIVTRDRNHYSTSVPGRGNLDPPRSTSTQPSQARVGPHIFSMLA